MSQATVERADQREHQRRIRQRSAQTQMLDLARHLPKPDQLLIEQIYHHGLTAADVARLTGVSAKAARLRVAYLVRRMRHPTFRLAAEHAHMIPANLEPTARHRVLHGQSLRTTAARPNRTLNRVRMDMQALYTLTRTFVGPVHRPIVGERG